MVRAVRPEMTTDEAISYLRRQARERPESLYYAYALDADQRLLGVVSFRELFVAAPTQKVSDIMRSELVTVHEDMAHGPDLAALTNVLRGAPQRHITSVTQRPEAVRVVGHQGRGSCPLFGSRARAPCSAWF